MKANTSQLVKFQRLKMRMKAPKYHVSGLLEELWQFTARNAPLGDIGKFDNADIAAMVEWDGDPDDLVDMLLDCGWLDESEAFRIVVHDWHDHAPNYVKGNVQRHHGNNWASRQSSPEEIKVPPPNLPRGEIPDSAETSLGENPTRGHEPPKDLSVPPYEPPKEGVNPAKKVPTLPYQAKSNQAKSIQDGLFSKETTDQENTPSDTRDEKPPDDPRGVTTGAPPKRGPYTESFLEFWKAYPSGKRKTKKPDAAKAWAAEVESPRLDPSPIIEAVREYAESPEGNGDYCPGPGPWIRAHRWEDDRTSWYARQTQETYSDRNQAALKTSLEIGDDYISPFDQARAMIAADRAEEAERLAATQVDARIGGPQ